MRIKKTTVFDCTILEFDKHTHDKGNITVFENLNYFPFKANRVYYLYDVPSGESRGGHAHKSNHQLMIAASGSFDVVLNDGKIKRTFILNRPYIGLLIVPGIWEELVNFSTGATCLVLASRKFSKLDYIRDYEEFLQYKNR